MELVNLTPFTTGTLTWEPRLGERRMSICVKATFALAHGQEATLAVRQEGVHEATFVEGDPRRGVYAPTDYVPLKPRADVLLVGSAVAPGGAPVESLVVQLRVGDFFWKALRVTGDRAWARTPEGGLVPERASPFTKMPLRYERAALRGDNLAGVPFAQPSAGQPLPAIDMADERAAAGTPGFGPLPLAWRAKQSGAPEDSVRWVEGIVRASRPAPSGLDYSLFNAAPRDQQVEEIRGGASILLDNLHPRFPRFEARLPDMRPKVFHVDPSSGWPAEVDLRCDTLWIDADRVIATLSFRGVVKLPAEGELAAGRVLIALQAPGENVTYEDAVRRARERAGGGSASSVSSIAELAGRAGGAANAQDETVKVTRAPNKKTLPFKPGPASPEFSTPSPAKPAPDPRIPAAAAAAAHLPLTDSTIHLGDETIKVSEPFNRGKEPLPFRAPGAPEASSGEAEKSPAVRRAGLPPSWGGQPEPSSAAETPAPVPPPPVLASSPPAQAAAFVPPPPVEPPARLDMPRVKQAPNPAHALISAPAMVSAPPLVSAPAEAPAPAPVSPPPLLSAPALVSAPAPVSAPVSASVSVPAPVSVSAPVSAPAPAPVSVSAPAPAPETFPVEKCAAIAAQIDQERVPRSQILDRSALTLESWRAIHDHWAETIRTEMSRGKMALLRQYDAAYVEQLEKDRGPIQVDEYARLVVGLERGYANDVLDELKLPRGALMRIQRLWVKKLAAEPAIGELARKAMERAREA